MRIASLLIVSGALLAGFTLLSASNGTAAPAVQEENPLGEQMEQLNGALRRLRKTLTDPSQRDEILAQLQKAQVACVLAKGETPNRAKSLEGAERTRFVNGYRNEMIRVVNLLLEMEGAVLSGDHEKAANLMKPLMELKKSGHDAYQEQW